MEILGIDIGGSGVKAAVVDTKIGKLVSQKVGMSNKADLVSWINQHI